MWRAKEKFVEGLLALPGAIFIVFFWVASLIILLIFSFFKDVPGGGFMPAFTFENYIKIFTDPFYLTILCRTLVIAIVVTIVALIISYPVAYKLARIDPRKAVFFLVLIIIPFLTATIFRVFGLVYALGNYGVVNSFLSYIGVGRVKLIWNWTGVIIGFLNTLLPYAILSLYSCITQIDKSLEEAAYTLGANKLRTTWHVILPLIRSGIGSGAIFVFVIVMGTFEVPSLLGRMKSGIVASVLIQQQIAFIHYPMASALSFVLLIIVAGGVTSFMKILGGRIKL
jgi:ABC-type spermidine/putrescine transport system permease subunit I